MAKKTRLDKIRQTKQCKPKPAPHDYGPTLGAGPMCRPTYPHPDSPQGRALARAGKPLVNK